MGLPLVGQKAVGFRTFFGAWIAPGSRVTFLGPAGVFEDTFTENNRVATLNAALARCRSGKNDVIFVLPGYSESITSADFASSLVAGTKIIGLGIPGETTAPKLTWTTADTASFLLDVADVLIQNMTLDFAGVADVAAPLTISAAGCGIEDCRIIMQSDTLSFSAEAGINVASGGNRFRINRNVFISDSEDDDGNVTGGCVNIAAAVVGGQLHDNEMTFACPGDNVGIIDVTAAAKNLSIRNNYLYQLAANAAFGIIIDNVAAQGILARNFIRITEDVAPGSAGVSMGASALFLAHDNEVSASSANDVTDILGVDS